MERKISGSESSFSSNASSTGFNHSLAPTKQLTTVNSLPPEILVDIFNSYCSSHIDDHAPPLFTSVPRQSPHPCPINISHVSRLWRSLVLSIPSMWTRIFVTFDLSLSNVPCHKQDMVEAFLQRSGEAGLQVVVVSKDKNDAPFLEVDEEPSGHKNIIRMSHRKALETLLQPSALHRLESLAIRVSDAHYIRYILGEIGGRGAPVLKDFAIAIIPPGRPPRQAHCFWSEHFLDDTAIDMSSMPAIRDFALYAPSAHFINNSATPNWTNLRKFRWESECFFALSELLEIVACAPMLEEIHTTLVPSLIGSNDADSTPCVLRNVSSATFICSSHAAAMELMSRIIMPRLKSFALVSNNDGSDELSWPFRTLFPEIDECGSSAPVDGFKTMIPTSLETLSLHISNLPEVVTLATLQALPNLKRLGVRGMQVTNTLLDAMKAPADVLHSNEPAQPNPASKMTYIPLCPCLEELDIEHRLEYGVASMSMILSRTQQVQVDDAVQRLKRVNALDLEPAHQTVIKMMIENRGGLDVKVTYDEALLFP